MGLDGQLGNHLQKNIVKLLPHATDESQLKVDHVLDEHLY